MKELFVKLKDVYNSENIELIKQQDEFFELRELLANIVAYLYFHTNWFQIASGKEIAPNIFQHRLYFASKENTIEQFIEKMSKSLSIQDPLIPLEYVHRIMLYPDHMNFLRERTRIFSAYAMKLTKKYKEIRKQEKDE